MQDLRRSNFTAADCRDCNFKNSKLQGTYFIKAVVARANFEVLCIPLQLSRHDTGAVSACLHQSHPLTSTVFCLCWVQQHDLSASGLAGVCLLQLVTFASVHAEC